MTEKDIPISIHALLAESDILSLKKIFKELNFYPRSPCGERLKNIKKPMQGFNFYPRSPCGERPLEAPARAFLISYFEPRSPCGERLPRLYSILYCGSISIHALLAESDEITVK